MKESYLIDGFDLGVSERTGTYVITEEALTTCRYWPEPIGEACEKGVKNTRFFVGSSEIYCRDAYSSGSRRRGGFVTRGLPEC